MAFGRSYPAIGSYAAAKRMFEETKPLRGKTIRPIGTRASSNPAQIEKHGENYVVRLYSTDVITYRPDGSVVLKSGGWNSRATARAIDAMSPFRCRRSLDRLVVAAPGGEFVLDSELEFDPNRVPVNPPKAYKTKKLVNKELAKEVRAYYAAVAKYIDVYQVSFEGGTAPEFPYQPLGQMGEPLTDEQASNIAWRYIRVNGQRKIHNYGQNNIAMFWRAMYNRYDVYEAHQIELPYGRVE